MILEKEIEFVLAIDALKNVNRRNFNLDNSRRENTAEHSWQVVVFAQILYPYTRNKEKIDLGRVLKMLSIHDVVEIDAGDTFFFDDKANEGNLIENWFRQREFLEF
jgi:putative hydrolase of HD superfamily